MFGTTKPAPACMYLLADHLDAALAIGEDLLAVACTPEAGEERSAEVIVAARALQRGTVERIRALEFALIARIIKAREHASALARADARFRPVAELFASTTLLVVDAVDECTDTAAIDFETGDGLASYLKARGLIEETGTLGETDPILLSESFLLAARIELSALLDLVATFLDTLELHYELFQRTLEEDELAELEAQGHEPEPVTSINGNFANPAATAA